VRLDAVYAGTVTLASTVAAMLPEEGPVVWDFGGILVPVVPSLIGVLAALLVRIIVITSPNQRSRNLGAYNVAVTLLTMLGAATYITDHQLGPGSSFWTGVGCGALGVSIIEIARSQFFAALKAGAQTMFGALLKGKDTGS